MAIPPNPKIYHIVHIDRLACIVAAGGLRSYAAMLAIGEVGTTIGMLDIKTRRLGLPLSSRPGLMVGACVPFYFCSRSVMLYLMFRGNHPNLDYKGGQGPIIHLEADLYQTVAWAKTVGKRWAFTLSNAGSNYFEDRASLGDLDEIDWQAVQAHNWQGRQEAKQAEFLIEDWFPWQLVERIGVHSNAMVPSVIAARNQSNHRPTVEILPGWYY